MRSSYLESIFAAALVGQTIKAAAIDEEKDLEIVYLNTNIVAIKSINGATVEIGLYICNREELNSFHAVLCQIEDRPCMLFDSVFNYAKMHCSYEDLDDTVHNIKDRVINHRLKYF